MHFGTIVSRLQNEDDAIVALEALGDLVLFTEVQEMGLRWGELPGAYAAGAAARFAAAAGDADWVTLLARIERAADPAQAALSVMVRWALARDAEAVEGVAHGACGCGVREGPGGPS